MYFYLFCVNIRLILNSFYSTALFDKKVSLLNLYAIRVGLNNADNSRVLVIVGQITAIFEKNRDDTSIKFGTLVLQVILIKSARLAN